LLFAAIHSYHNCTLLVTGPAHNGTFKNILHSEKATGFIIILGKGDEDTVFSAFRSELERLSHLPIWNPRGRFIVMSLDRNIPPANYVPEEHKLIIRILGELWEKDVVNSIFLSHNMDVNTSRAIVDIHTWFPFTEDHCRGPADRTVILDQCVVEDECQFVKHTKLFPDKMSNFHGCVLRASTYPHEPFIIPKNKTVSNVTLYSEGVEIRVLQTIASQLNFTVEYLPKPENVSHQLLDVFGKVSRKQSDVGFGATHQTYNAIGKRDHTIGYVPEVVKWFGPIPKQIPHWKGLVTHFTPQMWLLILIVYLIVSILFCSLANVQRSVKERVSYKNPVVCFLRNFSVVLGSAVSVRPQTWFLRLFFVVWVYYCLLINTVYQSSLISVLTQPQFESPVDTVEKLLNSHMPYSFTEKGQLWYSEADDPASKKMLEKGTECISVEACLEQISSNQYFAVCGGGLHLLYMSYQKKYSSSGRPKFIPFNDEVVSFLASMFFRSGSPFLESFNRIIYRLAEYGMVLKFWKDTNLLYIEEIDDVDQNEDEDDDRVNGDPVVLTVTHLEGVFILMLLGLACSLTVFIIELLCFSFRKYLLSVREFKTRSFVRYKLHIIHKTLICRGKKSKLIGKVKRSP
jgi:hypothetical protein